MEPRRRTDYPGIGNYTGPTRVLLLIAAFLVLSHLAAQHLLGLFGFEAGVDLVRPGGVDVWRPHSWALP